MSKPINIAFLWHQHQPDYSDGDVFFMPWVRLHAVKDYYDILEMLRDFPNIKQTYNIVPSLFKQIKEYIEEKKDIVQILSEKKAADLSNEEKELILTLFFRCNKENMIFKYPRYKALFDFAQSNDAIENFQTQDWLDLQVWYNLTWLGEYSRSKLKHLFEKQENFSEEDKNHLLDEHINIMSSLVEHYTEFQNSGQIELSFSPYYHPILPLLIDTNVAHKSQDYLDLPQPAFQFKNDADLQIKRGIDFSQKVFQKRTKGMWCSEGSISDDTLRLLIKNKIQWTATDEKVLLYSKEDLVETDRYFPYTYQNKDGEIKIFFRDNGLSDKIGFDYQSMDAEEAVEDFINSIYQIREKIIANHGEDALQNAVVSIILDGENCWEYYPKNGSDFLNQLYKKLSHKDFNVIQFSQVPNIENDQSHILNSVRAGSWINANFDIWIGSKAAVTAWGLLREAREILAKLQSKLSIENYEQALEFILKAEGSDWFWWYCPYHIAENEKDFDRLFRNNLKNAYKTMGIDIPHYLSKPIEKEISNQTGSSGNSVMHRVSE